MNKVLEMREKRANLWNACKAFLDTHTGTDGMMSAEDTATYEKMEAEVVAMGKVVERLERQEALDLEMDKVTAKPLVSTPANDVKPAKAGRASDEYKSAFWTFMRDKYAGRDVVDYLKIGTDANGGYLVPDEYERQLIDGLQEENVMRKLAHVFRTQSGDHTIPVVASHGSASWLAEGAAYTESEDTFGTVTIGAHKLGTLIKVSEELLNDAAFNIESYIAKEFARRAGAAEEEAFLVGTGSSYNQPLGILAATGGASAGVTTAGASPNADEVIDLFYALKAPYRKNAAWLMNDSTIKAIRKLKLGTGEYLWQPALTAATPDTILNRPVYTSPFMPAIEASAKVMLFGDFNYYWIGDRVGRSFKRLNELYAANGQVGFLMSERVDAKLILPEAVKCLAVKG